MSKKRESPSLLSKNFTGLFSPIHLDANALESGKTPALYKFTSVFFPNLGPSILKLLLDMEKGSRKVVSAIKPEERERLIKELEGVTVEMRYLVKDKEKEIMRIPINISPSEVLKNATLVKHDTRYNKEMQEEMNKIIISFIRKEFDHNVKTIIERTFEGLLAKPRIPSMLKELISRRLINREGRLAEGTTIEDIISGKYARLFEKVVPEELINEALLIKDTIETCYHLEDKDYQIPVNEALREKGILEITLGEAKRGNSVLKSCKKKKEK